MPVSSLSPPPNHLFKRAQCTQHRPDAVPVHDERVEDDEHFDTLGRSLKMEEVWEVWMKVGSSGGGGLSVGDECAEGGGGSG